jgi:hypothetical protein
MWTQKREIAKRIGKRIFFWYSVHARAQRWSEVQRQKQGSDPFFFTPFFYCIKMGQQIWAGLGAEGRSRVADRSSLPSALKRRDRLGSRARLAPSDRALLFFFEPIRSSYSVLWRTRIQPPVYREEEGDQRSTQQMRNPKRRCRKERGS